MVTPDSAEPAKKKLKQTDTLSPYRTIQKLLYEVAEVVDGQGYLTVRGIPQLETDDEDDDNDDDNDDDDNCDPNKWSQAQVDHIRYIILTKGRDIQQKYMLKLVLGDQWDEDIKSFNTSYSYEVLNAWTVVKPRFHRAKKWSTKFDMLLCFTDTIRNYDTWMHDHEGGWGGEAMVRSLGFIWKVVLSKTDQELGIDAEFTRPGIIALLEKFKEDVESVDTCDDPPMLFAFQ